ncbi:L-glutaminase [Chitinophaga skermanii]|uniref:Glutaminase n=1 Tax=Chitinophaga skermanii TaxID=331697 RepID=A0A327R2C6_9BACT|nr:glutaminase A [Chitinophaga skermanii]RAJ10966.1 L-glutaminase [Chitinophaga skermanii]
MKRTFLHIIGSCAMSLLCITAMAQVPRESEIKAAMQEAYDQFKSNTGGANANYIPYLDHVNKNLYGIVVATVDGKVYELGDTKYEFGIESCSKIFVLALAMQERGLKQIEDSIGVDATGMPFNSVIAIELEPQRTVNPLVNAGAMATNSFVQAPNKQAKWEKIDAWFTRFAGRKLPVIEELYKSESETNQHNQGIALLLQSYGRMYDDPLMTCDLYTRQCSYGVSARDLAIMGATFANGGKQPVTKDQIIDTKYVPRILAIMATSGLYDGSGDWLYRVGLPAKSGVGGGIVTVVPGKMAICVFAPPLDKAGNSVKAQLAIQHMVKKMGLNLFDSVSK